jgi:hypothetical protein
MTVQTIKAERVVSTALALLEREVVLPATVWRDAAGDFRGAKNDTISIRLPAYTQSQKNALRSGGPRSRDSLAERKVDVTLSSRLYKDIEVTDEVFSLDLVDFMQQVMAPCLRSIVRGYEDELAELMTDATYAPGHTLTLDGTDPIGTLREARKRLNLANVPQSDRFLAVGADVEEFILNATTVQENIARTGDASALRDAQMGRLAGFQPFVTNALPPGEAYAYHRTAFALSSRAPAIPNGAPWGQTMAAGGFAIRAVQVLDPTDIVNVLATEAWVGTNVVTDFGQFDEDGRFTPGIDPESPVGDEDDYFVRAVKIVLDDES